MTNRKLRNRSSEFTCKFCSRSYAKEKTLFAHMCPGKKRFAERDCKDFRIAFRAYQTFYKKSTRCKTDKTELEFVKSTYYTEFIKFAKYIIALKPIDGDKYTHYLISSGVKINRWYTDDMYREFLLNVILTEPAERALERSVININEWANDTGNKMSDFFTNASIYEITDMINTGKVSPWVIYAANTFETLDERMDETSLKMVDKFMNPYVWNKIFSKNVDSLKLARRVASEMGL